VALPRVHASPFSHSQATDCRAVWRLCRAYAFSAMGEVDPENAYALGDDYALWA
jgi:hypothetical protein